MPVRYKGAVTNLKASFFVLLSILSDTTSLFVWAWTTNKKYEFFVQKITELCFLINNNSSTLHLKRVDSVP